MATTTNRERQRIERELQELHFALERRRRDLENVAKLIGLLEEKIKDRETALNRMEENS